MKWMASGRGIPREVFIPFFQSIYVELRRTWFKGADAWGGTVASRPLHVQVPPHFPSHTLVAKCDDALVLRSQTHCSAYASSVFQLNHTAVRMNLPEKMPLRVSQLFESVSSPFSK